MKKIYVLLLFSLTFLFSCNQNFFTHAVKVNVASSTNTTDPTSDTITNISGNVSTISTSETMTVSFDYTATTTRDIAVSIKLKDSPWTTYATQRITGLSGSGNTSATLSFDSSNLPAAGSDYIVEVVMLENGSSWTTVDGTYSSSALTITSGSSTSTDSLSNFSIPTTVAVDGTLNIDFDYTTSQTRRIYVAVKSEDWSTEYETSDMTDVSGSGSKSISFDLTGLSAGTYNIAVVMLENSSGWTVLDPAVQYFTTITVQ